MAASETAPDIRHPAPEMPPTYPGRVLAVIPALNEEASLRALAKALEEALPEIDVLVVNDGSRDGTAPLARSLGFAVADLPHNTGVGCAMQTGFQYAVARGYDAVLRLDADGQHPPAEAAKLFAKFRETGADLVVGSRYLDENGRVSSRIRSAASRFLAWFIGAICRTRVTDPTSGFWLVSSPLLDSFARDFPTDYPEPEAIAILHRQGYSFAEAAVSFRTRNHGRSSIGSLDALYFMVKVIIALVADRVRRLDRHDERRHVVRAIQLYGRGNF